jgi:hypothetical protein
VYRKRLIRPENAMLKRRLQSAGERAGDFFAGEVFSVRLKKRKGPGLAHFFSTVHQKGFAEFKNYLVRKGYVIFTLLLMTTPLACL